MAIAGQRHSMNQAARNFLPAYEPMYPGSQSQYQDLQMQNMIRAGGTKPTFRRVERYAQWEKEALNQRLAAVDRAMSNRAMLHNAAMNIASMQQNAVGRAGQANQFYGPNVARNSFRF